MDDAHIHEQTSAMLVDIVVRLQQWPGASQQDKRNALNGVLASIVGAAGISMDGNSLPVPTAPTQEKALAAAIGTEPDKTPKNYGIYPYARPSLGSSATVIYTDKATKELHVLLVQDHRTGEYGNPAGYINLWPEPKPGEPSAFVQVRPALEAAFHETAHDWRSMDALRAGVREQMKKANMPAPPGVDLSAHENMVREVKEESGLDLAQLSPALVKQVSADLTFGYSSGGKRPYTVAPHFLVDLGERAVPPPLNPQDKGEISNAAWVPVRAIEKAGEAYSAGSVKINAYAAHATEKALHEMLSEQIRHASGGLMDSAGEVRAAAGGWLGKIARMRVDPVLQAAAHAPDAQGRLPTLLGEEGQNAMQVYVQTAESLARPPSYVQAAAPRRAGLLGFLQL